MLQVHSKRWEDMCGQLVMITTTDYNTRAGFLDTALALYGRNILRVNNEPVSYHRGGEEDGEL